jgi:hypothetical protein
MSTSHMLPYRVHSAYREAKGVRKRARYDMVMHDHQAFGLNVLQHEVLLLYPDPALWTYVRISARFVSCSLGPCLPSVRPVREGCDAEGTERSRLRRWAYIAWFA